MDTVTKWEYLTAWRYTVIDDEGLFKKNIPREVLEVTGDSPITLDIKLGELGAAGWELVTETPHVSEVEPDVLSRLIAFDSTTHGRVKTHGYTLMFKLHWGEMEVLA